MIWADEDKKRLATLVGEGQTLGQIGVVLGRSRNSIAGMMNALGLKSQSGKVFSDKPINRKRKNTYTAKEFLAEAKQEAKPMPALTIVRPQEATKDPYGSSTCQWPIGHPNAEEFRFCGDARTQGKPYCQAHCDIAYRKPQKGTGGHFIQRTRILAQALETLEAE